MSKVEFVFLLVTAIVLASYFAPVANRINDPQ